MLFILLILFPLILNITDCIGRVLGGMCFAKHFYHNVPNVLKVPSYKFDQKEFSYLGYVRVSSWHNI